MQRSLSIVVLITIKITFELIGLRQSDATRLFKSSAMSSDTDKQYGHTMQ